MYEHFLDQLRFYVNVTTFTDVNARFDLMWEHDVKVK